MTYAEFLESKKIQHQPAGIESFRLAKHLKDFQAFTVDRALRLGRMAAFLDCGMGKTVIQLEWAAQISKAKRKPVIVVTPLAVSGQTVAEAEKFGYAAHFGRTPSGDSKIQVTNYASLGNFSPEGYAGIVIDESSILKGDGPMRKSLQAFSSHIPYRLACSATPAPNDYTELGNHSEFVGSLSSSEMLATYFVHDGGETSVWRLKGHARRDFWKWVASWAVFAARPSDIGFSDDGYILPPLAYHQHVVGAGFDAGLLFEVEAESLSERRQSRKDSLVDRCSAAAQMVNASTEPWIVWCGLNSESELLAEMIPDSVEVQGSHSDDEKERAMAGFSAGRHRVIVTKPSIAGFGMNWQHCRNQAFVGLSDSWEQLYQAVRRSWRFGQREQVNVHIITSKAEGAVVRNIQRKDAQALAMASELSSIAKEIYVSNC